MRKIRDIASLTMISALGIISAAVLTAQPARASVPKPSGSESIIPVDQVTIDYDKCALRVATNDDEVMVAFPTVRVVDDEIVDLKVKSWDVYTNEYKPDESNVVTIDLSPLKMTRDSYVAVKTNATEKAYLIHFSPLLSKLKAQYDPETRGITIIDRADNDNECDTYFEYRTANSGHTIYDPDDDFALMQFEMEGATLYLRELGGYVDDDVLYGSGTLAASYIASRQGAVDIAPEYVLYDAIGKFAGKELKVKIPKLANGPTASANYNKRIFTVKKGCEYRLNTQDSFKATGDASVVVKIGNDAGVLEVRKAEKKLKTKYTSASKLTRYVYPATKVPTVTDDSESPVGKKTDTLSVRYDPTKKKVDFINTDMESPYLIYVVSSGSAAPVAGDKTLLKVSAAKSAAVPSASSTSVNKLPAGSSIYVAYGSVSKNKQRQWASDPILLGTIKY